MIKMFMRPDIGDISTCDGLNSKIDQLILFVWLYYFVILLSDTEEGDDVTASAKTPDVSTSYMVLI